MGRVSGHKHSKIMGMNDCSMFLPYNFLIFTNIFIRDLTVLSMVALKH